MKASYLNYQNKDRQCNLVITQKKENNNNQNMACLLIYNKNNYGWQFENYCTVHMQLVLKFEAIKTTVFNEFFSNVQLCEVELHITHVRDCLCSITGLNPSVT